MQNHISEQAGVHVSRMGFIEQSNSLKRSAFIFADFKEVLLSTLFWVQDAKFPATSMTVQPRSALTCRRTLSPGQLHSPSLSRALWTRTTLLRTVPWWDQTDQNGPNPLCMLEYKAKIRPHSPITGPRGRHGGCGSGNQGPACGGQGARKGSLALEEGNNHPVKPQNDGKWPWK